MPNQPTSTLKPVSEIWRPDLVHLPHLYFFRRMFRRFARGLCKLVIVVCTRWTVEGLENFPSTGPALVVINHRGDADAPLLVSSIPVSLDALGKVELYALPIIGKLMGWYGIIWLHRGRADRRAMRAALDGLAEGRIIVIAPEGRYSLVDGLEAGSSGAAFLASKAKVPVVPVVVIGTESEHVYGHLKRLQRAPVILRVGKTFRLNQQANRRETICTGTNQIMAAIARLLPEELRGAYKTVSD